MTSSQPRPQQQQQPQQIVSATVLPAYRQPVTFRTADGLDLVGELALPADRPPAATLIMCHPLPTHGGSMDSHLIAKAAARLPAMAGIAVLRFNTRGTVSSQGSSQGVFSAGRSERYDIDAVVDWAKAKFLPRMWMWGWSFGTDLTLMYGCRPEIEGAILVSPPLARADDADLARWAASGKPVTALVPQWDDYVRPDAARRIFAPISQAEVIGVDGAHHLFVGEKYVRRVLGETVARVLPGHAPLPTAWPPA